MSVPRSTARLWAALGVVATLATPAFASGGRATHFVFDPLDRTTRVTLPDGSLTKTIYGFGEGLHRTEVVDAENRRRVSLADVRGNVTAIDEILSGSAIRTRYRYSALSELLDVTDARGNQTTIAYDTLGRRTRFTNPDRGRIDYQYDPAGNLIRLVDDNLRANGEAIEYRYEFSRLLEVVYPRSPHVLYEYGAPNAAFHRAGRIAKITDESGIEERFYGSLGELTKSTKTVRSFTGPEFSGTYSTEWIYDTFGRMREITYPDGEVLTYEYDQGGRVVSARGKKHGKTQRYLDDVAYDAFGSRVKLTLGNGVVTNYAYDPNRRWLAFLKTSTPEGEVLQELTYTFDRVGNILKLADAGVRGGVQEFSYDSLDRLKTAQGTAKLKNGHETRYHNAFDYDEIHNLVGKVQTHVLDPGPTPQETNYTLNLTYDGPKPHALSSDGEKNYFFDSNGNQTGWDEISGGPPRRRISWNEENRITVIADPGPKKVEFLYDAGGQRVVKSGIYGETATVNAFFTARNASVFTKHIFVGETRIASHVVFGGKRQITRAPSTLGTVVASVGAIPAGSGDATSAGDSNSDAGGGDADPPDGPGNSGNAPGQSGTGNNGNGPGNGNGGNGNAPSASPGNGNSGSGGPGHGNGVDPCDRGLGKKVGLDCDGSEEPPPPPGGGGGGTGPGGNPDSGSGSGGAALRVFFYHPDHLGSSSWLTDGNGRTWERLAYFPFGEVWIDEGNTPGVGQEFRFTGKEQDPETGLYYYGARYYDGRSQIFSSVDPWLSSGAPSSRVLSGFLYANANPLRFTDPDGRFANDGYGTCASRGGLCPTTSAEAWAEVGRSFQEPAVRETVATAAVAHAGAYVVVGVGAELGIGALLTSGVRALASGGPRALFAAVGAWLGQHPEAPGRTADIMAGAVDPGHVSPTVSVHRVFEPGKPKFQLRQGEEGLSVFDASKVGPEDILPSFRSGSQTTSRSIVEIDKKGLCVRCTPGDPALPPKLQEAHMEIQPGPDMTRKQFKKAIKELE